MRLPPSILCVRFRCQLTYIINEARFNVYRLLRQSDRLGLCQNLILG